MNAIRRLAPASAAALCLTVMVAQAQQAPPAKPLGDVAREQQQARKADKKPAAKKVFSEVGEAQAGKPATDLEKLAQSPAPTRRSVFDQAPRNQPDFIIVPAGTEIRVDIVESKVIVPVRVGFSTPIPALSIVAVKVNQNYYTPVAYNLTPGAAAQPLVYGESAELTSVTVRGVSYPVQARAVPLSGGLALGTPASLTSTRDAVFVLTAPLPIER